MLTKNYMNRRGGREGKGGGVGSRREWGRGSWWEVGREVRGKREGSEREARGKREVSIRKARGRQREARGKQEGSRGKRARGK